MRRFLIIFFIIFFSKITYSQSGVGYLNYTIYTIQNNGAGAYANNSTDFVNMFDLTKGATVYSSGTSSANNLLYFNGSFFTGVPNGGNYFGLQVTGSFIPTQTGTYSFAITGDDAEDFSINENVVVSDYGPHGFNGYRIGTINLVAGQSYTLRARFQQWGGGWGMYLIWNKPDNSGYAIHSEECYTSLPNPRTEKVNFNFTSGFTPNSFSVNTINEVNNVWSVNSKNTTTALTNVGLIDVSNFIDTVKINNAYKPQGVQLIAVSTDSLNAMISRVVTISDVYLAFKEYSAGGGLFGTGGSTYFTSGIQYMNADVNNDGVFDEKDCYRLLQFLTGQKSLLDTMVIGNFMKLSDTSTYNSVTKANWMTKSNITTDSYRGIILQDAPNLAHNYYVNVYWKGDVNMSHSPAQTGQYANMSVSNSAKIKTMAVATSSNISTYVVTEIIGGNLVMTLTINPGLNQIAGVQYQVNYDNTMLSFTSSNFTVNGNPTNFATDKNTFINVGSLNMTGGILDNTTKIVLTFTPKQSISNSFGLLSITSQEAINTDGTTINNFIK